MEDDMCCTAALSCGTCRYCGQAILIDGIYATQTEADKSATSRCDCNDAKQQRVYEKAIIEGQRGVQELFGENAQEYGFVQLADNEVIEYLCESIKPIAKGLLQSIVVTSDKCIAQIIMNKQGTVRVIRKETRKRVIE